MSGTRSDARLPLAVLGCAFLAACAAGDARFTVTEPAGFWIGLWHGLIAPIAFVIGWFSDGVEIYERANSGGWYDFGYLIGLTCLWRGSHHSHRWWKNGKQRAPHLPARVTINVDWADEARPGEGKCYDDAGSGSASDAIPSK
jgi:hypothetical protein